MAQTPAPGQIVKLFGRTTDFKGKTLWDIVGNLRDYGVGRIVIRNMFQRYKEPCFMKIIKVEATGNEDPRKVKVTVDKVFRGVRSPQPVPILRTSYKADYILIPKDKENEYTGGVDFSVKVNEKILPRDIDFPPLLRQFLVKETGNQNLRLKLNYVQGPENLYRVAEEGEKPTVEFAPGLGVPTSPNLFKNIVKS